MKILHIGKYFHPFTGGIEHYMAGLMEQQIQQGHQLKAIVHHHQAGKSCSRLDYHGVDVYKLNTFGGIPFVPLSWRVPRVLSQLLTDFQPDVIHLHVPNIAAFWGLFNAAARKIPWVVHWHSDVLDHSSPGFIKMLYPVYRRFEIALLKHAKAIIATSPPYAQSSVPLQNFADKITVVPLALQAEATPELQKVSAEPLKLLCIGRLAYYKGYRHMLKAFSLAVSRGASLQLDIVGEGEQRTILEKEITALGLNKLVRLHGQLSNRERDRFLQKCDLFCLPSIERTEAFGLVLLEAMCAAKPCLVSNLAGSGMSWVVRDSQTGYVYKARDSQDLATKLLEISDNYQELPHLGQAGRQRFLEEFQMAVTARKIEKIYLGSCQQSNL